MCYDGYTINTAGIDCPGGLIMFNSSNDAFMPFTGYTDLMLQAVCKLIVTFYGFLPQL